MYLFRRNHNDSQPPGTVAAFSRFWRRNISDYLLSNDCKPAWYRLYPEG